MLLELSEVSKSYESPGSSEAANVLKGISLKVRAGESIAVVGPSGCGKSTLLNIMGALDKPTSGKVVLEGRDLVEMDDAALSQVRCSKIGFVFQLHHLLNQCTVLENVLVPTLAVKGGPGAQKCEERALHLLETVGLKDHLSHKPGELSGGQRQRVAVVRALINKPAILLADEPTGSLDNAATENIANLLIDLNIEERVTLVVVTHSTRLAECMGRVFQLDDGVLKSGVQWE